MKLPNAYVSILNDKGFEVIADKRDDPLWGTSYTIAGKSFACCVDSGRDFEEFISNLDDKASDVDTIYEDELIHPNQANDYVEGYHRLLKYTELYYKKIHLLKAQLHPVQGINGI